MSVDRPVAVLGGTFNPIHYGHLRSAIELLDVLNLAELRLMPCALPPHREPPGCSAEHRATMVDLAIAGAERLRCDRRELDRSGPSYTIDSLESIRRELGDRRSLCLIMGGDAIHSIRSWYRWQELLDYCHIVVIARPGWQLPDAGEVSDWLAAHRVSRRDELAVSPAGMIWLEALRPLAISSTDIRTLLAAGRSPRYLLPEPVVDYIERNALY
ncbi:MAG: nicotinate-nucleotide adenylyltransferase [Pseudomonadota bacterium]